ncbi:MAG: 1-deoxy-D-xylulose-5-phosphate reductoisomerase [Chloroflexi bacterium]|nr:1-deoxy-D-xylulose-5-phosphate reductoisomerase [Chloroflexota bacterium]
MNHPDAAPTGVALIGSTGSIGRQALDVLARLPDRFRVVALAAGTDRQALEAQARAVRPAVAALADPAATRALDLPAGTAPETADDALIAMATRDDVGLVVIATGGVISLRPVLAALGAGKVVATANKETLVVGGHLVMPLARERAAVTGALDPGSPYANALAWLRPIDSEHSAIWQCLVGEQLDAVARLVLTASGGPFRRTPGKDFAAIRPEDALAHPTWQMGAKITIDSATLMNKGLEVIEARWLYDVDYGRIAVVIHPQSVVHSLVEFIDGSLKAQLGLPDMRIPIQYALTFPQRVPSPAAAVDLLAAGAMTFEAPDHARFPAVRLAERAGRLGPHATAALIAADEVAVERFLGGTLDFPGITALAAAAVDRFGSGAGAGAPGVDELVALDEEVRAWCRTSAPPDDRGDA